MLESLTVKDFALIRELNIQLGPGLNLITGETGAGKSVILGALSLVLGYKATTDMIRSGAKRATVEAAFAIPPDTRAGAKALKQILSDQGLDDDEGNLLLRREISTEGKGRSFVNARQVPSSVLREIGKFLVDIHGQNEHQNILSVDQHRAILDRYAHLGELVAEMRKLHRAREEARQKLSSVTLSEDDKARRLDILQHEVRELEAARIDDVREIEELIQREKSLANAETLVSDLNSIHEILGGESGFVARGGTIERLLESDSQYDDSLGALLTQFRESYYAIEEIARTVRSKAESYSLNPDELEEMRERIGLLQSLARKYGGKGAAAATVENNYAAALERAKAYLEKAKNELTGIELSSGEEARLRKEIETLNAQMKDKALYLSEKRRLASLELEQKVQQELKALGMEETQIKVSIRWEYGEEGTVTQDASGRDSTGGTSASRPVSQEVPSRSAESGRKYVIAPAGLDIVEFLMASSARDTLRPLRKIASGGEMSRVMLALKKVIIETDPVDTMVFDEVDAGVGGRIAEAVGKKLANLSLASQVIVITHLHQIAGLSPAEVRHFKVSKHKEDGTRIGRLSKEQRLQEVARMIAGENISESALTHARQLLAEKIG
ncbi:MAG: DNA repair protein RecN [Spirochaetes bacterium]|nr:DNA repair protein RecN [Spirochaetota bacterium]